MVTPERLRAYLIGASSFISVCLITLAYASSGPSIFSPRHADAESTHDLLVSYASKDTDGDGLPDWEESLYGTDPNNPHSVNPSMTDAEAVNQGLVQPKFRNATSTPIDTSSFPGVTAGPKTLTDQFSQRFILQYMKARGASGLDSASIAAFVEQQVAGLKNSHAQPDSFNQGQVIVSGSGPDALLAYQAAMETIVSRIDANKKADEVQSFSDAVNKGDAKALARVKQYSSDYATAARAVMKVRVPSELAASHLKFANGLMHVSEAVADMGAYDSDPIRTMLGIASYQNSTAITIQAMKEMYAAFTAERAIPADGALGSDFFSMTKQAATAK